MNTARRRGFRESDTMTSAPKAGTASEKQLAFLASLTSERDVPGGEIAELNRQREEEGLSKKRASEWIEHLLALPKKQRPEPEAGMYRRDDGEIVRVYLGQQSGRMLLKRVVDHGGDYSYEYVGAAARHLRDAKRMTLDEAKQWGKMTGHCCVCGRRLDVPESVEAGIGPVCGGRV